MSNRVFITGEAGSLASNLRRMLVYGDEYEVIPGNFGRKNICTKWSREPELDLLDLKNIELLKERKPDIIFHLAGLVGTPRCEMDKLAAMQSNVQATLNIAEAYIPGQLIVYFGTTVMHDTSARRPFTETTAIKPKTLYGLTKYMGEEILTMKIRPEDLLIIRPCFVYGGKYDHASVITSAIRAKLRGEERPFEIPLDTRYYKDYYYIDNFLSDLLLLIKNEARGVFNLAKGTPDPFGEVMQLLGDRGLLPSGYFLSPNKDYLGDHYIDDSKARSIIGPTDKVDLNKGIHLVMEELQNDR